MVIEGLKFKILVFGTLAHAHDTIFDKYCLLLNSPNSASCKGFS